MIANFFEEGLYIPKTFYLNPIYKNIILLQVFEQIGKILYWLFFAAGRVKRKDRNP